MKIKVLRILFVFIVFFLYWIFIFEDIYLYKLKYNLTGKFDNTIIEVLKNEDKVNDIFKLDGSGHNFSFPFSDCLRKLDLEKDLNQVITRWSGTFYVLSYKNDTLQLMEFIVSREIDFPAKYNLDKHLNSYKYLVNFISLYNKKYNTEISYKLLPEFIIEKTWRINTDFSSLIKLILIPLFLYFGIILFKKFCIKQCKNKVGDTNA